MLKCRPHVRFVKTIDYTFKKVLINDRKIFIIDKISEIDINYIDNQSFM